MLSRVIVVLLINIGILGCSDESLYSGLNEREANEIVALLSKAGIVSYKSKSNDDTFTVLTARENFADAIDLLKTNGYPRNRFETLGEVFKKEGFVSSPLEERARLNYAQSQELSRTIESIDGVILARVHLAIPKDNVLESENKPSSASVFIKHRRGINLTDRESQIKALLVNSIEGLPYENVTVAMFSSNPMPVNKKESKVHSNNILSSLTSDELNYLVVSLVTVTFILVGVIITLIMRNRKPSSSLKITNTES
jgi:type III secretion protein J